MLLMQSLQRRVSLEGFSHPQMFILFTSGSHERARKKARKRKKEKKKPEVQQVDDIPAYTKHVIKDVI